MAFDHILESFGDLLAIRFSRKVFTTEDSVRYTLFAALLRNPDFQPEAIVLEQAHPAIPRAEVDMWIPPTNMHDGLAVEFKYDREIPSARNAPRTQKAGKVFHDIYRLGLLPSTMQRLFVYVASAEMVSYFQNRSNGLTDFFDLPKGKSILIDSAFLAGRSNTFTRSIAEVPNVAATMLHSRSLPSKHVLRVFEVRNVPSTQ
jgi:hypothetical protein